MIPVVLAIAAGVPTTILVSVVSFVGGAVLGVPLALGTRARNPVLRGVVRLVVDVVRSVPILVWLFVLYFGVSIGAFRFDALPAAVLTLGVVAGCYLAEVYRTALEAVPPGQTEAGRALGLGPVDRFLRIVAPQALQIAVPSMSTYALTLLKDSSIPSVIGVTEIAFQATAVSRTAGSGLTGYVAAAVLYLVLSIPVAVVARVADRGLRRRVAA